MSRLVCRFFGFVMVCACLSGCIISDLINGEAGSSEGGDAVEATRWDGPVVRPGVALIIQVGTVSAQPMILTVMVDQNGEVSIPHLLQKPVACDGLTLEELKAKLVKEYSFYIRQPQVSVTFAPYDGKGVSPWGTITVIGEVMTPGPVNVPSTMNLTVTKALQMAGGFKPFADKGHVRVTRCEKDGRQTKRIIDWERIGSEGRADQDMLLRGGDVVYVPEKWY